MKKEFTMSKYTSAKELYKAKSDYYRAALDKLWEIQKETSFDEVDRDIKTYNILKELYHDKTS